jgi:hypothetical protein
MYYTTWPAARLSEFKQRVKLWLQIKTRSQFPYCIMNIDENGQTFRTYGIPARHEKYATLT